MPENGQLSGGEGGCQENFEKNSDFSALKCMFSTYHLGVGTSSWTVWLTPQARAVWRVRWRLSCFVAQLWRIRWRVSEWVKSDFIYDDEWAWSHRRVDTYDQLLFGCHTAPPFGCICFASCARAQTQLCLVNAAYFHGYLTQHIRTLAHNYCLMCAHSVRKKLGGPTNIYCNIGLWSQEFV